MQNCCDKACTFIHPVDLLSAQNKLNSVNDMKTSGLNFTFWFPIEIIHD